MFDRQLFINLARRHRQPSTPTTPHVPPVAPLPRFDGQPPVLLVLDHADLGVDLAYEKHYRTGGLVVRGATRATTLYWIPRPVPVYAVSAGSILFARKRSEGFTVVVDHGNDWLTVYSRLAQIFVPETKRGSRELRLAGGDHLGILGATNGGPFRPLRFEIWRCNRRNYDQVDPILYVRRWRQKEWPGIRHWAALFAEGAASSPVDPIDPVGENGDVP